jgi:hypothetical protein
MLMLILLGRQHRAINKQFFGNASDIIVIPIAEARAKTDGTLLRLQVY